MTLLTNPPRSTLPRPTWQTVSVNVILFGLFAASLWAVADLKINVATIIDSADNAVSFIGRIFPLDFPPIGELVTMTAQTLGIVLLATVLSVILSMFVALAAAHNTTPGTSLRWGARAIIVVTRTIPELVLAILFLRLFGLGAVAGILALGLHSIGMVGKLYADAIEDTDPGPRDALRAAGASWWQQIVGGVFPQAMPAFVATALHRFDINLRASVILGYVGVSGIGLELSGALRTMNYQRGMALALFVVALCIVVELISGALRKMVLGDQAPAHRTIWTRMREKVATAQNGWLDRGAAVTSEARARTAAARTADGNYRVSPPWTGERIRRTIYVVLFALALVFATWGAQIDLSRMADGFGSMFNTLSLFFPPGTGGIGSELWEQLLVTVQIALAATFIGLVVAVPVGLLAARNVAPTPGIAKGFRIFIVAVRGIPDLIFAIIVIVVTGLGATAGAIALSVGAIGLLSKLIADSVEETDVRVQQAVLAGGATRMQVLIGATVRQSGPAIIAHIFYQLDSNIRAATLLGVVGAGGIGFYLMNAARVMQFDVVTMVVVMIFVVVMAVEGLAIWVRRVIS
ncbi:phosphonate transport system permease protein [Rhodococcus rhodochrous J3]|uniref:Phosphonate ABC transporter, permease protein PhnE n=2 Tax=Rhodococcus rhodochrous TaxID=1829 RepID=A0AA46X0H3_RHORH|nr:phosphonate ABC transporter, permease protein PhnE [Rhodococcus rhodochrous]TWH55772.1 phosphonate transport system permease protein [Rhodococcus rhodochrous J38]UZF47380.1 phosphonate ABC transporter, permease protein PhnE [Rhodococcus rhodochrous]SMG12593.1 phosphonate transport system permease protein [Rhodococcus rhodochrous J3]